MKTQKIGNNRPNPRRSKRELTLAIAVTAAVMLSSRAGLCSSELPTGEQLVSGGASVSRARAAMQVTQTTDKAILNWQSFSIGSSGSVTFKQPSSSSVALDRVVTANPSQIDGSLTANGKLFLVNPSGIIFGKNSSVNVGGLLASTMAMSDSDFQSGNWRFTRSGSTASILNQGSISASDGGLVALFGATAQNEGVIEARLGSIILASGEAATLTFENNGIYSVAIDPATVATLIDQRGIINADGGTVLMRASTADELLGSVINTSGVVRARGIGARKGTITILGNAVFDSGSIDASATDGSNGGQITITASRVALLDGTLHADGAEGGTISISAPHIGQSAPVTARGSAGAGGSITLAGEQIVQSAGAQLNVGSEHGAGGNIDLRAFAGDESGMLFSSGSFEATGTSGGSVLLTGDAVSLYAASIDASGETAGGEVLIGGDYQGRNPNIPNAQSTTLNAYTTVKADALQSGLGGKVIVWSDAQTAYAGSISAQGGADSGDGGFIEVSGKENLAFAGNATAAAAHGQRGTLLLDPKNITLEDATPASTILLANPDPAAGDQHGISVTVLTNDNVVVTAPSDSFAAASSGAAYLYSGTTGALISALRGSAAGDNVGNGGVTALSNGNYMVGSTNWHNGSVASAGAATWGNGISGTNGVVSQSNSLVGSTASDQVGSGVTALSNGNYVVRSKLWDNGSVVDAGAVTWGNGGGGTSGVINAINSLVGSTVVDQVGYRIYALSNGNYVVLSPFWHNGSVVAAGAATWGNGSTGTSGVVSAGNSLIGSKANDRVGLYGVTALANGNYVVISSDWDNGSFVDAGAVTWSNGSGGTVGIVSASNSLVGSAASDGVGIGGVIALSNGNYLVSSPNLDNGSVVNAGAATWGNGSSGISGVVSASNSLVGSTASDQVGSGVTALSNGNYVVSSPNLDNGSVVNAGAATWGNGSSGTVGIVSASNSLVGSTASDQVGYNGATALTNGNYVVRSSNWHNGSVVNAGAATWGNGSGGTSGVVAASNSLVGSTAGDQVGSTGVTALSNGNYVVSSSQWDKGSVVDAGAATWGSGSSGTRGVVSVGNSLVGSAAGDSVGSDGVTALKNGNYVVSSSVWDNGSVVNAGAMTWGNGSSGTSGVVSASNSLVGSTAYDQVGYNGVTALSNGNYVGSSTSWSNGSIAYAGAVTWGNGTGGTSGVVSAGNSLVGSTAYDQIGSIGVTALSNGNYVVRSQYWDNGSVINAGAMTWGNGSAGTSGVVGTSNSVVGSTASDSVGTGAIAALSNGRLAFGAASVDLGGLVNSGAAYLYVPGSVHDPVSSATFAYAPSANSSISIASVKAILDAGTAVVLQANNDITVASALAVAGSAGGALTLQAGHSILFNASVSTANGNLTAVANDPGAIAAQRDAGLGSIVIGPGVTLNVGTGTSTLAGQTFINNSGASALQASGAGHWRVWSSDPARDTRGGLAYDFKQYNATYGSSSALGTGNGFLYTLAPTITASLTGTTEKIYDATTTATLSDGNYTFTSAVDGDTAILSYPSTGQYSDKNVGTGKHVTASGLQLVSVSNGNAAVYGYQLASTTASGDIGTITPRNLAVTGLTALDRVYDASRTAALSGTASLSPLGSDSVTITGTASALFDTKNVGTGKTVAVTGYTLGGDDAANYTLSQPAGLTATITAASLTITGLTAENKVYDATSTAALGGTATITPFSGDVVTLGGSAVGTFADKNVGSGKAVTVTGNSISGADAANYNLVQQSGLTANITSAELTVTGLAARNKLYDQTRAATLDGTATIAPLSGDQVTLGGNPVGTFADSGVGVNKPVSVTGNSISGADAANYTLVQQWGVTATIYPVLDSGSAQYATTPPVWSHMARIDNLRVVYQPFVRPTMN